MLPKIEISATIVLFNEEEHTLQKTIDSFLSIPLSKKLYLVDNSKTDALKRIARHPDIVYLFNGKNIGFGKGHNLVLNNIKDLSEYHLILNPDVSFSKEVIPNLIEKIKQESTISMIVPKVIYPDGTLQHIYRKFPTFFDLVIRRLQIFKNRIASQEYQDKDFTQPFYPEAVHGCFMLFKTDDFIQLNGFDQRYFLYLEDIDICRKIYASGKKILFYPQQEIIHIHRKGSAKKLKLLFYHLSSAIKYFLKWSTK